jgi:hypothetical protein
MSTTRNKPGTRHEGLRPASFADRQLDHLEHMLRHTARDDTSSTVSRLDYAYWEQRVRELAETHDLVATQRHRVIRLLDLLSQQALFNARNCSAA